MAEVNKDDKRGVYGNKDFDVLMPEPENLYIKRNSEKWLKATAKKRALAGKSAPSRISKACALLVKALGDFEKRYESIDPIGKTKIIKITSFVFVVGGLLMLVVLNSKLSLNTNLIQDQLNAIDPQTAQILSDISRNVDSGGTQTSENSGRSGNETNEERVVLSINSDLTTISTNTININGIEAKATTQAVPDTFVKNPASINNLAQSLLDKKRINQYDTNKGIIYVVDMNDGGQTLIAAHNNILAFVRTAEPIKQEVWVGFINAQD